jgi:hypothetical protein
MAQWADASSTTDIEHSSADVELENFDPNYDPSYDLEANCPMCRSHTTAAPDMALATQLESKYPTTYAERRVEEEVERGSRVGQDGVEGFMILIGNRHKLVRAAEDDNQHDWTFFVRMSRPELVKEVRIDLVGRHSQYCTNLADKAAPDVSTAPRHASTPTIRGPSPWLGYLHTRSDRCAQRDAYLGSKQRVQPIRS